MKLRTEPLELPLHLLQLPSLLLDHAPELAILLHDLRARRAAPDQREPDDQARSSRARAHWPMMTE